MPNKDDIEWIDRQCPKSAADARRVMEQFCEYIERLEAVNKEACCAYCGARIPGDAHHLGEDRSGGLAEHIKSCPKHPMRELELRNQQLGKALLWSVQVIRDWHNGSRGVADAQGKKEADKVWPIYLQSAPEMRPVWLVLKQEGLVS